MDMDSELERDLSQQLGNGDDSILPHARYIINTKQRLTRGRADDGQEETQRRTYVSQKVWDYIDWQLRYYNPMLLDKWCVEVLGQAMDPTTFQKKMNRAVKATDQSLRNHARTRPPAPEMPSGWSVYFCPDDYSIKIVQSDSVSAGTYFWDGPYMTVVTNDFRYWLCQYYVSKRTTSVVPQPELEEEIPVPEESYQEPDPPTASAAATMRGIPITPQGMAAPVVDAMSIDGRCSWNINNELFQCRQPQSYGFMKSPAMSIRQSSVNSTRSSAVEMLSFSMRSMQL